MKTKFFKKNKLPPLWGGLGWGLLWLCLPFVLSAQNGVTMTNLAMDAGTVTFDVSWKKPMPVDVWSDTVWVFVDYNNNGKMERLPLASGATLTASSWDKAEVIEEPGNNNGVWVVGNARSAGSFSATVQLLTASTGGFETRPLHGACVYASNYLPVGEYTSVTNISFTGTPPYALVLKQAGGATYSWSSLDGTFLMPEGFTVESFTDKTGAPGVFIGSPMPADPDVTPGARCGSGTVTLSASSSSAGAVIDWYGADSGDEPALSSANDTYAPFLTETTTFYAQARYPDSGLTSARVPVTATVHLYEGEITGAEN